MKIWPKDLLEGVREKGENLEELAIRLVEKWLKNEIKEVEPSMDFKPLVGHNVLLSYGGDRRILHEYYVSKISKDGYVCLSDRFGLNNWSDPREYKLVEDFGAAINPKTVSELWDELFVELNRRTLDIR